MSLTNCSLTHALSVLLTAVLGAVTANAPVKAQCPEHWVSGDFGFTDLNEQVVEFTVFDDGGGPALFVARTNYLGGYTYDVAKWDGSSFSALGSGMNSPVRTLAVFDDGGGPALYAGGSFSLAGGVSANGIAKWDGTGWSPLGSGITSESSTAYVLALAVFDDGGGPALYAGGSFTTAGGISANNIAKWDGTSWSALGSGVNGVNSSDVESLAVHDDGSGLALYAGGASQSLAKSRPSG